MSDGSARAQRREHWRGVVEQWRQSGLSRSAFCRAQGMSLWQLRYWIRECRDAAGADAGPVFAPVRCVGGSGLRLRLGGGLELEVEAGFDEATLRRLVRALGPAPC